MRADHAVRLLIIAICLHLAWSNAADFSPTPIVLPTADKVTNVTLHVRTGHISIPLEWIGEEKVFFEYTGRFYEEGHSGPMLPGPTLRVKPGGRILLTLVNNLGKEGLTDMKQRMNYFHGPNITNVHFHGMHSDPKKDNPFKVALPGETLVYKINIPRDHKPGFHWYHTHTHGASYHQLMGGLFGAIHVEEGDFMATPAHPLRGCDSHILMVHLYRLKNSERCDGMPMSSLDVAMGSLLFSDPRIVDRNGNVYEMPADLFLVNGQHRPTVTVKRGHPTLLHIAFAAGSCYMNMSLPTQCTFHLAAIDGTPVARTVEVAEGWQYFTTATRRSLAVVCRGEGTFPVHHSGNHSDVIFYIKSENGSGTDACTVAFPATMPTYSADYLYLEGSNAFYREISLSQQDVPIPRPHYVLGQGSDCRSLKNSSTCYYEPFQGEIASHVEGYHGFTVPLYAVVTARVYGDPTDQRPHPFHFHVNHFKFVSFEPRPGGVHENETMAMYGVHSGEFRDTIPILDGVTTIRWQAATYTGEVVYHCHALHHEDRGMMLSYLVYSPLADDGKAVQKLAQSHVSAFWSGLLHLCLYVLCAAFSLVMVSAAVLWFCPERGIRSLAEARHAFDAYSYVGTPDEHIPLVPSRA
ncbi:hypothetical protein JKF63_07782 [Porcisia hertigi]|uniref:Multicopper oxidase n=1 Tax=Porcisia hertigi TaxID=2761500 RepID=A0A836LLV3_9TRYP|nr:hypothetical protein JKF63_07782 [Porcisia hertigi]